MKIEWCAKLCKYVRICVRACVCMWYMCVRVHICDICMCVHVNAHTYQYAALMLKSECIPVRRWRRGGRSKGWRGEE